MYNDEDLTHAVSQGIFQPQQVEQFRHWVGQARNTPLVDEENFRLLNGFNDIFVVIASGLLLVSLAWLGSLYHPALGALLLAVASWGLAEYFVNKRRMALPAIGLLLSFLGAVFAIPVVFTEQPGSLSFLAAAAAAVCAAALHWRRFRVPITVAAATAAALSGGLAIVAVNFPLSQSGFLGFMFAAGLATFALAMYWDAKDPARKTRNTDIAFWLHLLSAPLIVHPVFSTLGILGGFVSVESALIVLGLYVLLAGVSIAVDRRAVMVSALVYVVYAFASLLQTYGLVSYSFALTGLIIGGSLLLLSAYWQSSRNQMLKLVPKGLHSYLPAV